MNHVPHNKGHRGKRKPRRRAIMLAVAPEVYEELKAAAAKQLLPLSQFVVHAAIMAARLDNGSVHILPGHVVEALRQTPPAFNNKGKENTKDKPNGR